MGRRGPPPKPSALKRLEGTYRPDRAARNELELPVGLPEAPNWLDLEARNEWARVVPVLHETGVLTTLDGGRLADYCMTHSLAIKATRRYQREGLVIRSPQGIKAHPAVAIAKDARAQARILAAEFGLTPSGRSRVSVPEKRPSDGAAEFLGLVALDGGAQ